MKYKLAAHLEAGVYLPADCKCFSGHYCCMWWRQTRADGEIEYFMCQALTLCPFIDLLTLAEDLANQAHDPSDNFNRS